MAELSRQFEEALLSVDSMAAKTILAQCREDQTSQQLIESLIIPALENIGVGWMQGTVALSQVYMSGRICEELVDRILPPASPNRKNQPRMAIAVLTDHHILGKRIVYSILRASGFDLLDYGQMGPVDLVRRASEDQVRILLVSTLMMASALHVKEVRERLDQDGSNVRIVVGGAPFRFDDQLWREVGANAMGHTASDAVEIINEMLKDDS